MNEKLDLIDACDATLIRGSGHTETCQAEGTFHVECFDADGNLKWSDDFKNVVTTVGKNLMLDSALGSTGGAAPGGSGPFLGLLSATPTNVAGDTMGSHGGWTEILATTATPRATCAWSSAASGAKSLSSPASFSILATDTVGGCFVVYGPSASASVANTSGTLLSSGAFQNLNKIVQSGDTLQVSYTFSM